ncbi:helicase associated domain-containing protein [Streptomyces sp. NPDC005406]|uniref:helicase associated domain-containing protein n=1 Tax=Streptomyces sp. NPDC005406 TaxID=3155339 RepID=UPI003456F562
MPEQRERLHHIGVHPHPTAGSDTAPAVGGTTTAFGRGLHALAEWIEREGPHRPVPCAHLEEIVINGQPEPTPVKLGVWVSTTRSRRNRLTVEQLAALAELGLEWARPVTIPLAASDSPWPLPAPCPDTPAT